jgi:hypothetical protein
MGRVHATEPLRLICPPLLDRILPGCLKHAVARLAAGSIGNNEGFVDQRFEQIQ